MAEFTLPNLTEADMELLVRVGVTSKAQFEKLGADKTHVLLEESGAKLDSKLIYRLRGAEHDIDWQILHDRAKRRHRNRYGDIDED
jgi:hypothetical protein